MARIQVIDVQQSTNRSKYIYIGNDKMVFKISEYKHSEVKKKGKRTGQGDSMLGEEKSEK